MPIDIIVTLDYASEGEPSFGGGAMFRLFPSRRKQSGAAAEPDYSVPTLQQHLAPGPPKRILALDGGGVRGVLAIAVLERIEAMLRDRLGGDPNFRLCHYFDLIGGTSTGSIIAGPLALGWLSADIKDLYFKLAPKVFRGSWLRGGFIRAKFDGNRLLEVLASQIGDVRLGSDALKTGIAIISRRVDTDSNWVVFNNPKSAFYEAVRGPRGVSTANKDYRLCDLIRASTAAPYYFQPQRIRIGPHEEGLFIDGGLTLHNNPSLQLVLLAALKGYHFDWPLAPDKLLVISVGTGAWRRVGQTEDLDRLLSIVKTTEALASTIATSENIVETVMQWISKPQAPHSINSEIKDMQGDVLGGKPFISYQRYNAMLTRQWLSDELGKDVPEKRVRRLWEMADPGIMDDVYEIGRLVAEKCIDPAHFPAAFDPAFERRA